MELFIDGRRAYGAKVVLRGTNGSREFLSFADEIAQAVAVDVIGQTGLCVKDLGDPVTVRLAVEYSDVCPVRGEAGACDSVTRKRMKTAPDGGMSDLRFVDPPSALPDGFAKEQPDPRAPSFDEVRALEASYLDSSYLKADRRAAEPSELVAALSARYPFLARGGFTALASVPYGWRRAVGIFMAEDIRTLLLAGGGARAMEEYRVEDVKEKWGELRWSSSSPLFMDPAAFDYLSMLEELYGSICGRVCIRCGSMASVRHSVGWVAPICNAEEGYAFARELAPIDPCGAFCVWERAGRAVSYKDTLVGLSAPVVRDLGLEAPLHVTEVWERLCDATSWSRAARSLGLTTREIARAANCSFEKADAVVDDVLRAETVGIAPDGETIVYWSDMPRVFRRLFAESL